MVKKTINCLAILVLCIAAAIVYGIAHDQITARICVEYFTIGHVQILPTNDPTLLAIAWGILATWWAGFLLGIPLAAVSQLGKRPARSPRQFVKPIARLLFVMACCATLAGLIGYILASQAVVSLHGSIATRVPEAKHVAFIADLWAHNASYAVGFLGGIFVIVQTGYSRFGTRNPDGE